LAAGPGRIGAGGVIVLITLLAYVPALHGGFIWDDDSHVTDSAALRTLHGLATIWTKPGAVMQYYPLVHTSFWVQYHLWQLNPFGYHLVNVLLQAGNAILLWRVLERLEIGGAWLAAAVFAIHPVQVESVAWISEQKNLLSGAFYLAAALAYMRFCPLDAVRTAEKGRWGYYFLAFAFFVGAMLSKTVACTWPVAILLLTWWKRGGIGRRDVWLMAPFVAMGAVLGLTTVWVEAYCTGARGTGWSFTMVDRALIAGRAVWFYAAKLAWPENLAFVYPRWSIDVGQWWQWAFPLAAAAVVAALWLGQGRMGRGPLVAVAFFVITLGPALGFVNVYPMRYSFVADHFQYMASIGLIVAAVAGGARVIRERVLRTAVGAAVVALLAGLTGQQGHAYASAETLWRDTLAKNPGCWMAHNNLGILLAHRSDVAGARAEYREALRLSPDSYESHNNLGNLLMQESQPAKAVAEYGEALRIEPGYVRARANLAKALGRLGRTNEAIHQYRIVVEMKADEVDAHYNLGITLAKQGRIVEACQQFAEVVRYQPDSANAEYDWGFALAKQDDFARAIPHYQTAVRLNPDYAAAHYGLGMALLQTGRRAEGIRELQRTLELEPGSTEAQRALDAANTRA